MAPAWLLNSVGHNEFAEATECIGLFVTGHIQMAPGCDAAAPGALSPGLRCSLQLEPTTKQIGEKVDRMWFHMGAGFIISS